MTPVTRPNLEDAVRAANHFALVGVPIAAAPISGGHIHTSFRVACQGTQPPRHYFIQCFNESVFPRLSDVTANIARVTAHLRAKFVAAGVRDADRRVLTPVASRQGPMLWRDSVGRAWRTIVFIEGVVTATRVASPQQAEAAGRTYGEFQRLLADLPAPRLHLTIRDFHDTPKRLAALEDAARIDGTGRAARCSAELAAIRARSSLATCFRDAAPLPVRVVHNDAKLSNVLFDARTGEALCVVDLDTVMPGLALDDFGDMVRSITATCDEDTPDPARVAVDPALFEALARGYLAAAGPMLSSAERRLLAVAGNVITFEQAVRFLTDFLAGDRYYRTTRADHNLDRARNQLALLASLERHAADFERMIG